MKAIGTIYFQQKIIIWSMRSRAKIVRDKESNPTIKNNLAINIESVISLENS
jgi:hypothetical protein